MRTFATITKYAKQAYTGRSLRQVIEFCGLRAPAQITRMYTNGESLEYITAASLAVTYGGGF